MSFICSRSVLKKKYWGTEINEKASSFSASLQLFEVSGSCWAGYSVRSGEYELRRQKANCAWGKKHLLFHLPFTSVYSMYLKRKKSCPRKIPWIREKRRGRERVGREEPVVITDSYLTRLLWQETEVVPGTVAAVTTNHPCRLFAFRRSMYSYILTYLCLVQNPYGEIGKKQSH